MRRFNVNRKFLSIILCLVLVCIFTLTLAYAALNAVLKINGNASIVASNWDIHLENPVVKHGSVSNDIPTILSSNSLSFRSVLVDPGDYYEFTVDVVNDGSIDAMIESVSLSPELTSTQSKYLNFEVSYQNGESITSKQNLKAGTFTTIKVRVEFRKDINISDLPSVEENLNSVLTLIYNQSDDSGSDVKNNGILEKINFTIDGAEYTADEGMTWDEWVNSKYNTIDAYTNYDGDDYIAVGDTIYISELYGNVPYLYVSARSDYATYDIHEDDMIVSGKDYYIADSSMEWDHSSFPSFFIVDGHCLSFFPFNPVFDYSRGTISWIEHIAYGYYYGGWDGRDMYFHAGSLEESHPYLNEDVESEHEWIITKSWQPYHWYGDDYAPDFGSDVEESIEAFKIKLQELKDEDFIIGSYNQNTGYYDPYYLCYYDGTRVKYGDNIMEFHLGSYILIKKET